MKIINATTIGNLISAHMEGDEEKFLSFANFIADAYEEAGEVRSARIIRKRIDGSYKDEPQVSLDWEKKYAEEKGVLVHWFGKWCRVKKERGNLWVSVEKWWRL